MFRCLSSSVRSDNVKRNHYKFSEWNATAFIFIFNAIFWTFYVIFVSTYRKIDRSLNFSPLIIVLRNFFTYTCFWNDIFYFCCKQQTIEKEKTKHVHEERERKREMWKRIFDFLKKLIISKQPFPCNSYEINKQNGASLKQTKNKTERKILLENSFPFVLIYLLVVCQDWIETLKRKQFSRFLCRFFHSFSVRIFLSAISLTTLCSNDLFIIVCVFVCVLSLKIDGFTIQINARPHPNLSRNLSIGGIDHGVGHGFWRIR